MHPNLIDGLLAVAAIGLWFAGYGLALLVTRPATPAAAPATQDLGTEPPAVVSLIAGGWDLTEDASEATLLDLAARRYLEFRQPAGDPAHTTVHVREPRPAGLSRYEQRVMDRVVALAVDGVLPLTALTFRNEAEAKSWDKRIRAEIVADARARGLSRRRFSPAILTALGFLAVVSATLVAVVGWRYAARISEKDPAGMAVTAFLFTIGGLAALGGRSIGERDTPAGREAAARWLGVRAWLRGHEAFADLPPAAVAVWDRYLAYGAALGTTRVASAVIELGMGNRKRVWSSFGGAWHRVRVRYPRFWRRYGKTGPRLVFRSLFALGVGYLLVRYWRTGVSTVATVPEISGPGASRFVDPVSTVGYALGVVLLVYGSYLLLRTIIDLATPATVTGQVLWQEVWRSTSGGENQPSRPYLHYLAVDDGRGDRTTAWALPAELSARCHDGDTVRFTGRRWTRRVTELTVLEHGSARHAVEPVAGDEKTENLILTAMGQGPAARRPSVLADAFRGPDLPAYLLTPAEIGHALSVPVRDDPPPPAAAGPVVLTDFKDPGGTTVLQLMVSGGLAAKLAMKARHRFPALPGVGDEAYAGEDWVAARSGDTVVMLHAPGRPGHPGLPWLLSQAVGRLSRHSVA